MTEAILFASHVATLVIGVVVLALFFKFLPRINAKPKAIQIDAAKDVFGEDRLYDVTLSSGKCLTALRFEGMVNGDTDAGWSLRQMAIMRRTDGGKVILRIDSVRCFEEVAQSPNAG